MTPAARAQAAIKLLDRWLASGGGMDRLLAQWSRASRYAGSGDRRAVADLVYDALRRMRSATWIAGAETQDGRALLRGSLMLDGADPAALFTGGAHAPIPLSDAEAVPSQPFETAQRAVRLDLPDWLAPELSHISDNALAPLRQRAKLFLRVNTLKADMAGARAALASDGVETIPGPLSPHCLLVSKNPQRVQGSRTYQDGLVEIQDAASQAVAAFAAAQPGETVLDFCAGGGGKTLALAAAMAGQGTLHAHDISSTRLAQLPQRAARAGAEVALIAPDDVGGLARSCDLVLVDAPCSGSGAWARNPDAKWRLTRQRLEDLIETQDRILDEAAMLVWPGGRLVYVTCSLIPAENDARVAAFLARNPTFLERTAPLCLTPADGGDGFFAAMLSRCGTG